MRNLGPYGLSPGIRSFVSLTQGSTTSTLVIKWASVDMFGDKFALGAYSTGEQYVYLKEPGLYAFYGVMGLGTLQQICIVKDVIESGTGTQPSPCRIPHESGARTLAISGAPASGISGVSLTCWLPSGTKIAMMKSGGNFSANTDYMYLRMIYLGP